MKAIYNLTDNLTVEFECDTTKELVDIKTRLDELRAEDCGLCGSSDVFLRMKKSGDDEFYAIECRNCGGQLQFGIHKKPQNIYKKKVAVDEDGKVLKDDQGRPTFLGKKKNGWVKYNPETKKAE